VFAWSKAHVEVVFWLV